MKKMITKAVVAGAVVALAYGATSVSAADASVGADFVSAYVFRGGTLNDGFVIQPGLDVEGFPIPEEYGALSVGTWANYDVDDYDGAVTGSQYSEIDYYGAYALPSLVEGVDLSLGYCHYAYGGSSDKEASVGASTEVAGVGLGATAYFMVGGDYVGQVYFELSGSYAYAVSEDIEVAADVTASYINQGDDVDDFDAGGSDDGFNDATFTLSASYALCESASVGVFGTYVAQLDDHVLVDVEDGGSYDVDFLGGVSLSASF